MKDIFSKIWKLNWTRYRPSLFTCIFYKINFIIFVLFVKIEINNWSKLLTFFSIQIRQKAKPNKSSFTFNLHPVIKSNFDTNSCDGFYLTTIMQYEGFNNLILDRNIVQVCRVPVHVRLDWKKKRRIYHDFENVK